MSVVPRTRLVVAAALVFLPASVLAAAAPQFARHGVAGCLAFVCWVLYDALRARRHLNGIRIGLPAIVRTATGRTAALEVKIEKSEGSAERIRIGLPLPEGALDGDLEMTVDLSGTDKHALLSWPVRPLRQGSWMVRGCYLEAASKWGFWGVRRERSLNSEIRVYPNLRRVRRQLSALELKRGMGAHAQRQVGKGKEFEQLRDYLPGDSIEDIHWKATARRSTPITKVYQIERTQQVYVVIDASRLSGRMAAPPQNNFAAAATAGPAEQATILERFTVAGMMLALAAERQGDHFGLLVFDDRIRRFLAAKRGKGHFGACRDAIYNLETNLVSPDFYEVAAFIGSRLRRRALLLFMTSLDDPVLAESFTGAIDVISRRHLILVNMLRPPHAAPLFATASVDTLDDVYAKLAGHLLWRRMAETAKVLQRRGITLKLLDNADLCPELIGRYLAVKRRQIL